MAGSFDPWAEDAAGRTAWEADWHAADATAAEQSGDRFAAAAHLTRLLVLRPDDAEIRRRLNRAQQKPSP